MTTTIMVHYYTQYHSASTNFWISSLVNSPDFAVRATMGQEGWDRFCQIVYPPGKPEYLKFCVVKGLR